MKKTILTIILITILPLNFVMGQTAGSSVKPKSSLYGVIIDTSPTDFTYWQHIKTKAKEVHDCLEPDERFGLFIAKPDRPQLNINTIIDSPNSPAQLTIYETIESINQAFFLSKADVSEAMELAFQYFDEHSQKYNCNLLILTDGIHNNKQVNHIRRLASAFKVRDWSVTITAVKNANRQLFLAASQGEFQISVLNEFSSADWVNSNRTPLPLLVVEKEPEPRPVDTIIEPPVNLSPETEYQEPPEQKVSNNYFKQIVKVILYILGFVAAVAAIYKVWKKIQGFIPDKTSDSQTENELYNISAEYDGAAYDIGEETMINNIIIGSGVVSAIPINDDSIEEEHLRLFSKKKQLWLENISSMPVTVNNVTVEKGKRELLLLPARIQLSENVRVDLFREQITKNDNFSEGVIENGKYESY